MRVDDLKAIANHGGGLNISAKNFTADDLKSIANHGKARSGQLILRDATSLSVDDMKAIANHSPGNVTFVL